MSYQRYISATTTLLILTLITLWEQLGHCGLCNAEDLAMGIRGSSVKTVCCRFGRTVWSIYMCSSTLIYLLFTKSVHTVHPQISMIQLVAPSQTVNEMLDGHRERWRSQTSGTSVFSFKRKQQKETQNDGFRNLIWQIYKDMKGCVTRWIKRLDKKRFFKLESKFHHSKSEL